MARIRSIHPGLLTDEAFMTLTVERPLATALYLGLLMESDDHGIFEWKPLTLKARILPAVSDDIGPLMDVLVAHRFVMAYEIDGRKFGAVRNFCKFQRPKKPNDIHPKTEEVRDWVSVKSIKSGTGSEPVPHNDGTGGENPPQMEDGGCRREEKEEAASANAAAAPAAACVSDFEKRCRAIVEGEPCAAKASLKPVLDWRAKGCPDDAIFTGLEAGIRKATTTVGGFRSFAAFDGWIERAWRDSGSKPANGARMLSPDEMAAAAAKKADLVARGVLHS